MVVARVSEYDSYIESGITQIGLIPSHWCVKKLKFCASINSQSLPENTGASYRIKYVDIGSVSFENGIEKIEEFLFGDSPSRARRLAEPGDTVVSTVRTYLKAIAFINEKLSRYVYSTGFAVVSPKAFGNPAYLTNFIKSNAFTDQVDTVAKGMSYPAINSNELSNLYIVEPTEIEQTQITNFLARKTAQIDEAIAIKERQVALLNERKQTIIQKAITQGLDPDVPMRDSGIDWIGEIPEHWDTIRLKYILEERNERSKTGEEPLLMVSQIYGLVVRSEYHDKAEVAVSSVGNKIVYKNDLVFNKLKAHLGVFFKSSINFKGLVSPDYAVYKPKAYVENLKLLELLFRNPKYIQQFVVRATGIVEGLIRLYSDELFDIPVPVAPVEEQREILNFVSNESKRIDEVVDIQRSQIALLKEYKTTLINSVITGKFRITPEMAEL
ncbi:restriction endonuclease subunit S [Halodesulfovibrio marinisediminis]|uniref:Type I restriction enzyme, S subunit n=1 Tax=Halodesulfovibrio marinisediminis DSM 17456 TaxID=1121457 RepID=A0A1N6IFQ1_9BACT|nr:restriction endonuclease subunit S [Halodesulfovibrio marinisediminis]SIO30850.1 type I restriction enzyme, S subunit [Halodesulfovibrio marinisediminis DSM 17456]